MDILTYNPAARRFQAAPEVFCETEVTPYVDQWEARDRIVPKSVWRKMGQGGFLCPAVDPTYGGLGGDFRYSVIVAEELARTATQAWPRVCTATWWFPTSTPTAAKR